LIPSRPLRLVLEGARSIALDAEVMAIALATWKSTRWRVDQTDVARYSFVSKVRTPTYAEPTIGAY
jgi:hypothetical protein